ncbi:MAG: glycosyltransferase [Candidatus Brocadiaceae bacterium]|nr:glycosyltransferase [Candidatus Brocadiaceae bacterium]
MKASAYRPRVLHLNEQLGWRGGEHQMLYLARGLHQAGIDTAVAVQPGSTAGAAARRADVRVHELAMRGEADLAAALRIARIARRERFNILHAHTSHAHMLALTAARMFQCGARVIAHRRIEFPVGRAALGLARLKYVLGVDAFIAISNRVKETLIEAGVPEWRVFVVRSVTDPGQFVHAAQDPQLRARLGIPGDALVVGNIGALVDHKDHRTLLEACRTVRDERPDTWVVIVGDGPLRAAIESKARSLHMADRLVLTGFRQDIPQLIRTFDVFALSSSEEGMCSTLLEVAACGLPIVAADAGGVREAVLPDVTGLIVPIRSPRRLAQGILKLANHPDIARELAERGRRRVLRDFTIERLTDRTLAVYDRVLRGRVGPRHPAGYLAD